MNESNQNIRTLIVSFAIAIFTLIPLRFVEVGQMSDNLGQPQVLGVEQVAEVSPAASAPVLEAPYDQIDGAAKNCIDQQTADGLLKQREDVLSQGGLDRETVDRLMSEVQQIDASICK